MNLSEFRRAGHLPTLLGAFLYFSVSCVVWLIPAVLANSIASDFGLSDAQKGLMVAVPLLGGAGLRLVLGLLTDRIGARRTTILGMSLSMLPLLLGWLWADGFARCCSSACCWAWRGRASPRRCHWRAAGIRRGFRGWRWGSPARATAARRWPRSSARDSP